MRMLARFACNMAMRKLSGEGTEGMDSGGMSPF